MKCTPAVLLICAASFALAACSHHQGSQPSATNSSAGSSVASSSGASSSTSGNAAAPASSSSSLFTQVGQSTEPTLPKPNFSTPESAYVPITSGNQLMYLYVAFSGAPPDYDKMAQSISQDYNMEYDGFKKHNMLATLKPKIDAGIANAKAHPYIILSVQPGIGHYDFQRKAFPVSNVLFQPTGYEQLNDNPWYELSFTNGSVFQQLAVPGEDQAKSIEALVSKLTPFQERIYAFVQGTDDSQGKRVKAEITKVELLGPNGRVLLQKAAVR